MNKSISRCFRNLLAGFAALCSTACASLSPSEGAAAAGGAVFGSAAYLFCTHVQRKSSAVCLQTAMVAGTVGLIAGGEYGKKIEARQNKYANKLDFYDAQSEKMASLSGELSRSTNRTQTSIANAKKKRETTT